MSIKYRKNSIITLMTGSRARVVSTIGYSARRVRVVLINGPYKGCTTTISYDRIDDDATLSPVEALILGTDPNLEN